MSRAFLKPHPTAAGDKGTNPAFQEWLDRGAEEALEPDLPICDAHHHLWDFSWNPRAVERTLTFRYLLPELVEVALPAQRIYLPLHAWRICLYTWALLQTTTRAPLLYSRLPPALAPPSPGHSLERPQRRLHGVYGVWRDVSGGS